MLRRKFAIRSNANARYMDSRSRAEPDVASRRDGWTEERMDGGTDGRGGMDGRMENGRRNGWTDGGWTEERMDGGTDGRREDEYKD